jgi:hypothetical protein
MAGPGTMISATEWRKVIGAWVASGCFAIAEERSFVYGYSGEEEGGCGDLRILCLYL